MDGATAAKNRKLPPIYGNLPKHANYVNFAPLKSNDRPNSCRLLDASTEKRNDSFEIGQIHDGTERVEESEEVIVQVRPSQEAGPEIEQTNIWRLTSNKMHRDFSVADQMLKGHTKGGGNISSEELKEEEREGSREIATPKAALPTGKNAFGHYMPLLYGRRRSEQEYQLRNVPSEATMVGEVSQAPSYTSIGPGCNEETGASQAPNNNPPRVFRCLIILLILVGLLSVEAMVLSSLSITRGAHSGLENQVSVVNGIENKSDVTSHTPAPGPTSIKTNRTAEPAKGTSLNLNTCQYKVKRSWSTKAEPTAANHVTLIQEKGFRVLGVSCSTSGAQEYILRSDMNQQRREFICECRGISSVFITKRKKMKCFLHYWECRKTETLEEHGA